MRDRCSVADYVSDRQPYGRTCCPACSSTVCIVTFQTAQKTRGFNGEIIYTSELGSNGEIIYTSELGSAEDPHLLVECQCRFWWTTDCYIESLP